MKTPILLAGSAVLFLTGCQSMPNPYPNGPGFYETTIEATRYRITYVVPDKMTRQQAEDTLLLRAADDTLGKGHSWFRVTQRSNDVDRSQPRTSLSLGTGAVSVGRRSAVGVGIGSAVNLSGGPRQVLGMEITMGDGARPNDPQVYDASDVAKTIRART